MGDSKYMVGNNSPKDIYTVGQKGQPKYSVGGTNPVSPGQAKNGKLSGGDQDGLVGSKSAFDYPKDNPSTYKDIGDRSEVGNFGGSGGSGVAKMPSDVGGELKLSFSEKGSYDLSKDAMARRKGMMDGLKQVSDRNSQFKSPVVDSYPMKK